MTYDSPASQRRRANARKSENLRRFGHPSTDVTVDIDLRLRAEAIDCPLCDVALTDHPYLPNSKEMDHIVRAANGGRHELSNVRIICRACNRGRFDFGAQAWAGAA